MSIKALYLDGETNTAVKIREEVRTLANALSLSLNSSFNKMHGLKLVSDMYTVCSGSSEETGKG